MPVGVIGIETVPTTLGGGIRIVTTNRGVIELYRDQLPANVRNKTAAEVETYINDWLTQRLTFIDEDGLTQWVFWAHVVVSSVNPLVAEVTLAQRPPV